MDADASLADDRDYSYVSARGVSASHSGQLLISRFGVVHNLDLPRPGVSPGLFFSVGPFFPETRCGKGGIGERLFQVFEMYYPHEPVPWFRWFERAPLFWLFRVAFKGANLLLGQWGNKLALAGVRGRGPRP